MDFKRSIAFALAATTGLAAEELENWLETPPSPEMGDYAFPCFRLAKTLKKAPPVIAQELAGALALPEGVAKAQAACLAQVANDARFENARQIGTITAFELRGAGAGYLADVALTLTVDGFGTLFGAR